MLMIMIVVSVVRVVMIMVATVVLVMVVIMAVIAARIAWFVFRRPNEVHGPIASIVFPAMLAPILGVSRRHV
jgi:hypothetical protein